MYVQVTQFLYRTIGLEFGVNAVITNGRVSIFSPFLIYIADFGSACTHNNILN